MVATRRAAGSAPDLRVGERGVELQRPREGGVRVGEALRVDEHDGAPHMPVRPCGVLRRDCLEVRELLDDARIHRGLEVEHGRFGRVVGRLRRRFGQPALIPGEEPEPRGPDAAVACPVVVPHLTGVRSVEDEEAQIATALLRQEQGTIERVGLRGERLEVLRQRDLGARG